MLPISGRRVPAQTGGGNLDLLRLVREAYEVGMVQVPEEVVALAGFLAALRPRHVLEIGSDRGGTFYLLAKIATGVKISVDLPAGPYASLPGPANLEVAGRMTGWAPGVVTVRGNSRHAATLEAVSAALGGELLDFLFIDGDHSLEGVKADFDNYRRFVRAGGWVALHDINDTPYHRSLNCFVGVLWARLGGNKIEFNARVKWGGIGLVQV